MIPRLLVALAFVAAAALSLLPSAGAAYPPCHDGYCAPTHYGRSYGRSYAPSYHRSHYRNQWSKWAFTPWDHHPEYFTRHHTWWDHCGNGTNYFDEWLYTRYWTGCDWGYRQHCLLSDYAGHKPTLSTSPYIDPLGGSTEVAYDCRAYGLAKHYPAATRPGMLAQKGLPGTDSANEILATFESTAAARVEYAHKSDLAAKDLEAKVFQAEQQRESEQIRIRGDIAKTREQGQQDERALAEFTRFLIERRQRSADDANPRSAGQITFDQAKVKNPDLAKLLNGRCVACHGAAQQGGKFDLRDYASFDVDRWKLIRRACEEKDMPKEGNPLTETELDLLDEQVTFARSQG